MAGTLPTTVEKIEPNHSSGAWVIPPGDARLIVTTVAACDDFDRSWSVDTSARSGPNDNLDPASAADPTAIRFPRFFAFIEGHTTRNAFGIQERLLSTASLTPRRDGQPKRRIGRLTVLHGQSRFTPDACECPPEEPARAGDDTRPTRQSKNIASARTAQSAIDHLSVWTLQCESGRGRVHLEVVDTILVHACESTASATPTTPVQQIPSESHDDSVQPRSGLESAHARRRSGVRAQCDRRRMPTADTQHPENSRRRPHNPETQSASRFLYPIWSLRTLRGSRKPRSG